MAQSGCKRYYTPCLATGMTPPGNYDGENDIALTAGIPNRAPAQSYGF